MKRATVLFLFAALSRVAFAQDLVIENARIIDGNGGVIDNGSVVVSEGRIVSVSAGSAAADGERIDAGGRTIMPAFSDAHRHIIQGDPDTWLAEEAAGNMRAWLEAGFTTILSAGDPPEQILELRRRLAEGEIEGPRLLAAGRVPLAASPGGFVPGVDPARIDQSRGPNRVMETAEAIPEEQTRAAVRAHAEAGFDAIKTVIVVTLDGPETQTLAVVADEARRNGIPSITHAVTVMDTLAAVEARTDVLVHTPHIGHLTEEQARTIVDSGIPMVSTLGIFVPTFAVDNEMIRESTGRDNVARFRDLEPFPYDTLSSAGQGPVNARLLWEAGLVYGYGTDVRFEPADSLAHELRPLRLVFSHEDIVQMLTKNAAVTALVGDETGTLEAGKRADIVILDGDPLTDINAVLEVVLVVKDGEVVVDNRN